MPPTKKKKSVLGSPTISADGRRTFERRETTVEDQLEIAKLSLGQSDGRKSLGLGVELLVAGSIAGEEILQDTAVRWVGHCVSWGGGVSEWRSPVTMVFTMRQQDKQQCKRGWRTARRSR